MSRHATSDALARMQALGAFLHFAARNKTPLAPPRPRSRLPRTDAAQAAQAWQRAEAAARAKRLAFCATYGLHEPTLVRMAKVRKKKRDLEKHAHERPSHGRDWRSMHSFL